LLDVIEDKHGARQADVVLAIVRGICNWYATRHDDYVTPVVRGMRRRNPKASKRARVLDDDELRRVWRPPKRTARSARSCGCYCSLPSGVKK
jgi:hypothetical protein